MKLLYIFTVISCETVFVILVAVSSFLLLNSYYSIRGIPTGGFFYRPDVMLPILKEEDGNSFFVATTADAVNGYVYFADSSKRIVQRRLMNATGLAKFHESFYHLHSMY